MSGDSWQPIATAPRDSNTILLGRAGCVMAGHWFAMDSKWHAYREPGFYSSDLGHVDISPGKNKATHWMPFPPAPGAA